MVVRGVDNSGEDGGDNGDKGDEGSGGKVDGGWDGIIQYPGSSRDNGSRTRRASQQQEARGNPPDHSHCVSLAVFLTL